MGTVNFRRGGSKDLGVQRGVIKNFRQGGVRGGSVEKKIFAARRAAENFFETRFSFLKKNVITSENFRRGVINKNSEGGLSIFPGGGHKLWPFFPRGVIKLSKGGVIKTKFQGGSGICIRSLCI